MPQTLSSSLIDPRIDAVSLANFNDVERQDILYCGVGPYLRVPLHVNKDCFEGHVFSQAEWRCGAQRGVEFFPDGVANQSSAFEP